MKHSLALAIACFFFATAASGEEARHELLLQRVIRAFDLRPLPTKPFEATAKFKLGRALFFDPILSGNRDVSCATCHLIKHGTSDGLAFSIGTGGVGIGAKRSLSKERAQQPRNALDLWNRDNNWVKSMFWDGRVEVLDPVRSLYRSPLGERLPEGFENVMAVQSAFPLAREDEMLGVSGDYSPSYLSAPHASQKNELASETANLRGADRIAAVLKLVVERLLGREDENYQNWNVEYRVLFRAAYPHVEKPSIVQIGNALSHFEEIAFATRQTPWDAYLGGDHEAIDPIAKKGALLFYGKARCSVCHRGPLFSDFEFHSVGVRDFGPGLDGKGSDTGRFSVTGRSEDKYKFRTPPLRNVTLTAPYFHNGSAVTLDEAIRQHLDPLFYADKYRESGAFMMKLDQIEAISPVLFPRIRLSGSEIDALKAFLHTLEDGEPSAIEEIIPASVPSGLPVGTPPSPKENLKIKK